MNWKRPLDGEERVVDRFAWLPVELTDPGWMVIWLERYRAREVYRIGFERSAWFTVRRWQP